MRNVALVLIGIFLLVAAASLVLQKRSVAQDIPGGERARLILPSYWSHLFGSTILLEREKGGSAKIRYDLFEQPLILLPGREPSTVICIYVLDIKNEIIVFDLGARPGLYEPVQGEEYLKFIVRGSELPFRRASVEELHYVGNIVREMKDAEYKRAAVPTLDLGGLRLYAPRQRVIEIVEEKLSTGVPPSNLSGSRPDEPTCHAGSLGITSQRMT